jgi:hypothetical protein
MRDASSTSIEVSTDRRPTWRDRAASWYRAVAAGADVREAPSSISIGQLVARLDLPAELQPALVLLYGAHLAGEGAAPIDIARVLDRNWAEALGRGELARRGIAAMDGSRVRLTRAIQRTLDELPPDTGTLVGDPGIVTLLGPCAVVADPGAALPALAERFRAVVGCAILVGETVTDAMLFEAAARGAVSMVRAHHVIEHPVILVADSEHDAEQLGVPRID